MGDGVASRDSIPVQCTIVPTWTPIVTDFFGTICSGVDHAPDEGHTIPSCIIMLKLLLSYPEMFLYKTSGTCRDRRALCFNMVGDIMPHRVVRRAYLSKFRKLRQEVEVGSLEYLGRIDGLGEE